MSALYKLVVDTLRDSEMDFEAADEHETVRIPIEGDTGRWRCFVRILPSKKLAMYSVADSHIPEARRPAMADFITRANFGIVVGNFEMDFSDGELRFKTSLDSGGEVVPADLLRRMLDSNLTHMNRYLPGIMGVAFGDLAPAEAIRRCEATVRDEDDGAPAAGA